MRHEAEQVNFPLLVILVGPMLVCFRTDELFSAHPVAETETEYSFHGYATLQGQRRKTARHARESRQLIGHGDKNHFRPRSCLQQIWSATQLTEQV